MSKHKAKVRKIARGVSGRDASANITANAPTTESKAKAPKVPKPPRVTKYGRLRAAIRERKSLTLADAVKASGFDEANVRVAFGIMRNKMRSKGEAFVATTYDRSTKTWTLVEDGVVVADVKDLATVNA